MSTHGDDSTRAAQFILAFDGDDTSFFLVLSLQTQRSKIVVFLPRLVPGHPMDTKHHLESAIWVEGLFAVQLAYQLGQHLLQSSSPLQEVTHIEISRLIATSETVSGESEIDKMMRRLLLSL